MLLVNAEYTLMASSGMYRPLPGGRAGGDESVKFTLRYRSGRAPVLGGKYMLESSCPNYPFVESLEGIEA